MKALFVTIIFSLLGSSIAVSKEMTVGFWRNLEINFSDLSLPPDRFIRGPITNAKFEAYRIISCIADGYEAKYMKKCYETPADNSDFHGYGLGLKFVEPIALIPIIFADIDADEPQIEEDGGEIPRSLVEYTLDEISALEPFQFTVTPKSQEKRLTNFFGISEPPDTGYSLAEHTQGGNYALELYQRMSGVEPTRLCVVTYEPCSIILNANAGKRPSYLYCKIFNSNIGMGIPFDCELLAFKGKAGWYVRAELGPQECDGCGAGASTGCIIENIADFEHIATLFEDVIMNSKIGIKLEQVRKTARSVKLIGKTSLKDSDFFSGYYENSYAIFDIETDTHDDGQPYIRIDGIYNLLISAEPSRDTKNFRNIQSNDRDFSSIEWLQLQVEKIIESGLEMEIENKIECSVNVI